MHFIKKFFRKLNCFHSESKKEIIKEILEESVVEQEKYINKPSEAAGLETIIEEEQAPEETNVPQQQQQAQETQETNAPQEETQEKQEQNEIDELEYLNDLVDKKKKKLDILEEKFEDLEEELNVIQEKQKREKIIKKVFLQYRFQYKMFLSYRESPIQGNFNELIFNNLCDKMTFDNDIKLQDELNKYNLIKKNDKESYMNLSMKRRLKCDEFNFYLFI